MAKIPTVEDALAGFSNGSNKTFEVDLGRGIMRAEPGEDYRNMMEAIRAHQAFTTAQQANIAAMPIPAAETKAPAEASMQQIPKLTLRQAIDHWKATGTSAIVASTIDSYIHALNHFAGFHGDHLPVASIRRTDISAWVAQLAKEKIINSTRKKMNSHITVFFDKAISAGHYPDELKNPAAGVVEVGQSEKIRRSVEFGWAPFTREQLGCIFTVENLKMAEMPHTRRALVIGLYTGARVGEIAQLRVDAFKHEDGVDFLEFNGELKNLISQRLIPIHPDLIRLGLMEWVAAERKRGSIRLFPSVEIKKKNKGGAISKGTSNLLMYLGIKIEAGKTNRLGFHSLRNNVIQELQGSINFPEERRRAYVGHTASDSENHSSHRTNYMRKWMPSEITPLFDGLHWGQWLDFDGLKALLDQSEPNKAFIDAKRNAARAATRARNKATKQAKATAKPKATK